MVSSAPPRPAQRSYCGVPPITAYRRRSSAGSSVSANAPASRTSERADARPPRGPSLERGAAREQAVHQRQSATAQDERDRNLLAISHVPVALDDRVERRLRRHRPLELVEDQRQRSAAARLLAQNRKAASQS